MIESIMYFGIGFLFAALIGVAVIPLVHSRAVRLTMRRLESSIPQSMAEIQADKDALRAEFAMSTRRLEMTVEQLKNRTTSQLVELGKKGEIINRLKIEREAQKVEAIVLKTEVGALKEQLTVLGKEVKAKGDVVARVPKVWPTELVTVPMATSQSPPPRDQRHEGDVASLVPKEWPTAEEAQSGGLVNDPDDGCDLSDQRIRLAREGSSARLQTVESSIHVSPRPSDFMNDQLASDRPSIGIRTSSRLARFFIVALIGVGAAFAWQSHGDDAIEMVRTWAPSLGSLLYVATKKLPPDVAAQQIGSIPASQVSAQDGALPQLAPVPQRPTPPTMSATSPEWSQQLEEPMERDLADVRKQEQTAQNMATMQAVEQDGQKTSFPALQTGEKLTPTPETRPTAIAGWMLLEVIDGTAVFQGPNGILRVTRGDTVPGLGRVNSIVRWGNRWVVATTWGHCKSALPNDKDGICKPYRGY